MLSTDRDYTPFTPSLQPVTKSPSDLDLESRQPGVYSLHCVTTSGLLADLRRAFFFARGAQQNGPPAFGALPGRLSSLTSCRLHRQVPDTTPERWLQYGTQGA
jgi:hypothetical protein